MKITASIALLMELHGTPALYDEPIGLVVVDAVSQSRLIGATHGARYVHMSRAFSEDTNRNGETGTFDAVGYSFTWRWK